MLLQSDERLVFVARRQGTADGALPRPFFDTQADGVVSPA